VKNDAHHHSKVHPTGGIHPPKGVHYAQVNSVKSVLSRPAHQRVTHTVGRLFQISTRNNQIMEEIKLTQSASMALFQAHQEAFSLKHLQFGPEHLLLALVMDDIGAASQVLREFGVNLHEARQAVDEITPQDQKADSQPKSHVITDHAQEVLTLANQIASQQGYEYVRTTHLLAAILEQQDSPVHAVWEKLGINPQEVRERVYQVLVDHNTPEANTPPKDIGELEDLLTTFKKCEQLLLSEIFSNPKNSSYPQHLQRIEMIIKKHFGQE
jgi:hypothetical protein